MAGIDEEFTALKNKLMEDSRAENASVGLKSFGEVVSADDFDSRNIQEKKNAAMALGQLYYSAQKPGTSILWLQWGASLS